MEKQKNIPYYALETDIAIEMLESRRDGLSEEEVSSRQKKYGKNIPAKDKKTLKLDILARQVNNPLIILLAVSSLISIFLGKTNEAIFIIVAILINIGLGFYQELKADNSIKKLESYISLKTIVIRGGQRLLVDSKLLVPGDIIILRSGDKVPADARILSSKDLEVDEAILTGESLPEKKSEKVLDKNTVLGDRKNMLYAGTLVFGGLCKAVITATGSNTEIGKIAGLVKESKKGVSPIQKAVSSLAKKITIGLLSLGVIILILGVQSGYDTREILVLSIAIIVSAIPESLPIALTLVLSIGSIHLLKKKGVVRKLNSAETLGNVSIIMTDKTGTITEGKLSLVGEEAEDKESLLLSAMLNIHGELDQEGNLIGGRPLEVALEKEYQNRKELHPLYKNHTIIEKIPFTSLNKFSGVLYEKGGKLYLSLLGAPDILINKTRSHNKDAINKQIDSFAEVGERILGVVEKEIENKNIEKIEEIIEKETFSWKGMLRFSDTVREGVREAIKDIKLEGVRTVLVTGDHPKTALYIAKDSGLVEGDAEIITGEELENMSDEILKTRIKDIDIFARVSPSHKKRLVEIYESIGEIVSVTGDGVNDAPALKTASIGVAMGSGTDVAKGAADLVLLDDNYTTIVSAIKEGRSIKQKMRTVIVYLLADSFDELLLIGGSIAMSLALPLNAIQILFVKFFSDIFPALGFTFGYREYKPTKKKGLFKQKVIDRDILMYTFVRGIFSSTFLFLVYFFLQKYVDIEIARTFTYLSFATYLLFLSFSIERLDMNLGQYKIWENKYVFFGVIIGLVTILSSVYVAPISNLLGTVALSPIWLVGVLMIGLVNVIGLETMKYYFNKR
ncbi:cation-transporting P-type ATPase [Candidatus Nomurabacteria bacterium]|nr:cation-transporting P-type ATPase [Candidatus Nomurabacteria bacterium]USN94853.1 MAG: cation-transporting P-type ATPase [Candidatus Nomurabacteria bacterium]